VKGVLRRTEARPYADSIYDFGEQCTYSGSATARRIGRFREGAAVRHRPQLLLTVVDRRATRLGLAWSIGRHASRARPDRRARLLPV
jgi:hypothetical protein